MIPPRRTLLLVALVAAAAVVPRAAALRGIETTTILTFEDMPFHLLALDRMVNANLAATPALVATERNEQMVRPQWPPGIHYVAALPAVLAGSGSAWVPLCTNLLFATLMVLGLVGLGRALGDLETGLWGAALALLCPPLVASSWYYGMDLPLVGMTTFGLLLLWRTRGYRLPFATLVFGLWSALGVLVKPTFPLYLGVPALFVLGAALRQPGRARVLLHAAGGLLASAGLLSLLLPHDWGRVLDTGSHHLMSSLVQEGTMAPWTLPWLAAYAVSAAVSFPLPLLLLMLPGVALAHTRRGGPAGRLLAVALWGGYVALTLVSNKMERYIHPLYPIICLLGAFGIARLLPRRAVGAALGGMVLVFGGTLAASHLFWPTPWLPAPYDRMLRVEHRGKESPLHPFRYELTLPGPETLSGLRQRRWHPECDLSPLVEQLRRWDATIPGGEMLAVAYVLGPNGPITPPLFEPDHRVLPELTPTLLQVLRRRFVFVPALLPERKIPAEARLAGWAVVLHDPQVLPDLGHIGGTQQDRRVFYLSCRRGPRGIGLTLSRQTHGPR